MPYRFGNLLLAEANSDVLRVGSLSSQSGGVLHNLLAVFELNAEPQIRSLAALAQTLSLKVLSGVTNERTSLLLEQNVYPYLAYCVPAWVKAQHRPAHLMQGAQNAKNLFIGGRTPPPLSRIVLPWSCKPESLT
jgi:hypothetical protein